MYQYHCFLEPLFSWEVVSLVVGVLLAVGALLFGDEIRKLNGAMACFSVAGMWAFGKLAMWAIFSDDDWPTRVITTAFASLAIGAGMIELTRLARNRRVDLEGSQVADGELSRQRSGPRRPHRH